MKTFQQSIEHLMARLLTLQTGNGRENWMAQNYINDIKNNLPFLEESVVAKNLSVLIKKISTVKNSNNSPCRNIRMKGISIPDLDYSIDEIKAITKQKAIKLNAEFEKQSEELGGGKLIEINFPITGKELKQLEKSLQEELNFYETEILVLAKNNNASMEFISAIEKHRKKHKDFVPKIGTEALSIFINLLRDREFVFQKPASLLAVLIGYPFGYAQKNLSMNITKTYNLNNAQPEAIEELLDFLRKMQGELLNHQSNTLKKTKF